MLKKFLAVFLLLSTPVIYATEPEGDPPAPPAAIASSEETTQIVEYVMLPDGRVPDDLRDSGFGNVCISLISGGFLGKPIWLTDIRTPGVFWGPHSVRNVLAYRYSIYTAGVSELTGTTEFGHPLGKIDIETGTERLNIFVSSIQATRYVGNTVLRDLKEKFPTLIISEVTQYGRPQVYDITSDNSEYDSLLLQLRASDMESRDAFLKASGYIVAQITAQGVLR